MKKTPSSRQSTSDALTARLILFAIVGAYFAVHAVGNVLNAPKRPILSPDFIYYFNPLTYAIACLVLAGVLILYGWISKRFVYGFAYFASLAYATVTAVTAGSDPLSYAMCGLAALMTVLCGWALAGESRGKKKKATASLSDASAKLAVGVVAGLVGGVALFLLIASYLTYTTDPGVSTGTYAQLMHSLRSAFSFDTTLEFGETVSHMAAHVSPIFLVYLPFYAILPSPVTLMVLQVAVVFSAVIPLWLIAKRHGLSSGVISLLCGLLCLYPATWGGAVGSLHEYAFLLPLLLWLLWAMETGRKVLIWVFAALVLCTRETAALHLCTVAIYWLITHRRTKESDGAGRTERVRGWILLGASALYFTVTLALLATVGRGTLLYRFANVTGEYGGFFDSFFREFFNNPALIVHELLTMEKLCYVLLLLLPLGCLPLLSRKKAGLVFLFPLLFLNLLADFPYHYNPDFPYGFGVTAFGLYLSILAAEALQARDTDGRRLRRILAVAVTSTLILVSYRFVGYVNLIDYTFEGRDEVAVMATVEEYIPAGTSVSASGRLRPNLAGRDELYRLSHEVATDVVVLDLREAWVVPGEEKYDAKYYTDKGYSVIKECPGVFVVLGK